MPATRPCRTACWTSWVLVATTSPSASGCSGVDPLRSAPPPDSLLPARYVRIQVASPPPQRVDGTTWARRSGGDGGGRFEPGRTTRGREGRSPRRRRAPRPTGPDERSCSTGGSPFPPCRPRQALTRTFDIGPADPSLSPCSFLSAPYPGASIGGKRLAVAGVAYYFEGTIRFDRAAEDEWIAVSLERFFPPERPSAELIVRVQPGPGAGPGVEPRGPGPRRRRPTPSARTRPTLPRRRGHHLATSASRSSPGSR